METLIVLSFQSGITLVFFGIMFLFVAAWYIVEIGKRNAKNATIYEKDYETISTEIDNLKVDKLNYDYLLKHLMILGQLKYKNKEMTSVLTVKFFRKFKDEAKKRIAS